MASRGAVAKTEAAPPAADASLAGAGAACGPDLILRLLVDGEPAVAVAVARTFASQAPGEAEAHYWLSSALAANGDAAAAAALDDARLLHAIGLMRQMGADVTRIAQHADAAVDVANQLYRQRYVATASVAYGMALQGGERRLEPLLSYGLSLQHQGRAEEAIQVFRAAAELYPGPATQQFLLFAHFYAKEGVPRHAAEARRWAVQHTVPLPQPMFANGPSAGRRLRVGYVAPSFAQNQLRQFIEPVIESHDREAFEIVLFPTRAEGETGWTRPVSVRPIGGLDDAGAADLIRSCGIDVLIDAWGHTAGSRLGVFAHRPAPVQAAWLNYQQTTGLPAMDYVLHADCVQGPGMAEAFVETIWRVGPTSAPFRPAAASIATPAPSLRNGYPTFGSFNNPAKLSDETVSAWARILKGRPDARLILKYGYFIDPVLCAATSSRFAAHGVDPSRIDFRGHTTGEAYAAEFGDVDLMLDPSPVPGGTTSLEALSRGVPVLGLAGPTFYSRTGLQILTGAGLDDLIASDWDDYVARALAVSSDAASLQALRERAQAGFAGANYRDEIAVTRDLERAYRGMFEIWERRRFG
jgi:protein O-GlcNAc transferase